jgi:hypothetical protein
MNMDADAVLVAWCERDRAAAVVPADHRIVEGSTSLRALIVDLATPGGVDDEIYDACAVLGRLIAQRGGSPTLAALTMDHAAEALGGRDARWIAASRAAVVEGYALALAEDIRKEALKAWDFPACAVPVAEGVMAFAAGLPTDDDETLGAWAARVANAAALKGVRRAIVAGLAQPRAALVDALSVAGIDVRQA